nr:excalibur calcium-binding domain-containing protein [uncultured Tolumonas sp.]
MRKLILLAAIGLGIYQYFTQHTAVSPPEPAQISYSDDNSTADVSQNFTPTTSSQFSCQGKTRCGQMQSFEEAKFYLANCPGVEMDGDGDGIPCERQFGQH